ncbi:MAG TPA: serine/threonine-protein kinase [Gemmatimonadaceae bacterium]|nr:serine/threonine-protein kinase [Gemmatimonadaceae bacterium]
MLRELHAMSPGRWTAVNDIVDTVLDLPPADRAGYVARACANDEALRRDVERLLDACARSAGFLNESVGAFAAPLIEGHARRAAHDEAAVLRRIAEELRDRYTVQRELGRGGMAVVYLARDVRHRRDVALKLLRPELAAALGAERFLREIETVARLAHPHIVPLLDSGEVHGQPYYVMPYVAGESLRERLTREGPLSIDEACRIAQEVANALDYAHRENVLHRDLKPENILLAEGLAVVTDFGIARAISRAAERDDGGSTTLTATGISLGTPAYMSPEQAAGSRELDARSDVYALGCIVYEMLAGQPPYSGPTAESIVRQHMLAPVPTLLIASGQPSSGIEQAVRRALIKDRAKRFASMRQFIDALSEAGPARAQPPPNLAQSRLVVTFRRAVARMRGRAEPDGG